MTGVGVEVLGVVAVGIGAAAVLFASFHALRKAGIEIPRWLLPAGIGLAMVSYSIWSDYSWYGRAVDRLPAGSEILLVGHKKQAWAPWTYVFPVAVRFAAFDPATIQDDSDGVRHGQIMLFERRGQTLIVPQDFDCQGSRIRRAGADWTTADESDPAFLRVCSGARG
ncbi:hypothetical protein [Paracoccus seriniphilus]|uniref:Uncharacterized protein n=1 Tax=Paracoccus seriniphilus TaxID=184748 RepID=A0A239PRD9_9RHOB|nr:hypothetical protein [Paracoccus seriniphilus]WCR12954.1 hypothetical protein JHW44_08285 [Paracoccus seriniphilus]SNT72613.1 hypothetical protein SAMN05444959_103111 [Paracoccus seriniphilus]